VKVEVEFTQLSQAFAERIASHIRTAWPQVIIRNLNNSGEKESSDGSAVLVVRGDADSKSEAGSLTRTIVADDSAPIEEAIYQVDAKLARLTNTELARTDRKPLTKATMSRRDFLLGFIQKPSSANDEPVVLDSTCEAKFGCTKCVDACPAPGALTITNKSVGVSSEHCVRCGLCAAVCPVAAIQMPRFSESAYRTLLATIHSSPAPKKTLVITCHEASVRPRPWMEIEEVQGVGVMGLRQLAHAANSSINALVVYCPDGLCVGRETVKEAVKVINSKLREDAPLLAYVEGKDGAIQIDEIHGTAKRRENTIGVVTAPWKDYVNAVKSVSTSNSSAAGLGLTEIAINDSCTLCNACVDACPHHAIAIQLGELSFYPEECTGCGYCEEICPERSITLSPKMGPINISAAVVYRDEMIKCSSCGSPYASAKMVAKVSAMLQTDKMQKMCPACKERSVYRDLFPRTPANATK